jgi:hypothetical protein
MPSIFYLSTVTIILEEYRNEAPHYVWLYSFLSPSVTSSLLGLNIHLVLGHPQPLE